MANTQFDQFKAFLTQIVNDPDVRRKNYVLQDPAYLADMVARVGSLTPDVGLQLDYSNALDPSLGMVVRNTPAREIRFNPKGFSNYLSSFREGTVSNPAKFWKLPQPDPHGARYLLADQGTGVLLLNSDLEVLFRFPGFGPIATGIEYNDSSAVLTFVVGATTYLAVALYSHHIVQIYQYTAPFTHLVTIGVLDTPGDTPNYCDNPRGLAFDPTAPGTLWVVNENGTPVGSTLDRGYLSRYNMSVPAIPSFVDNPYYYSTTGRLLDNQVTYPSDAYYDTTTNLLWVSNQGANEVGAFSTAGTLARYLPPSGNGYTFRETNQVYVSALLGGYYRIYVCNGATAVIEEFDGNNLRHLNSYGARASEDELNGYNRMSTEVYGAIGYANAVVADTVWIDDQQCDVLVVGDSLNRRLSRFNQSAYTDQNFINFELLELQVPISVTGWAISGDVPMDLVKVQYRFAETETFRDLSQQAFIPASSTLQFRLIVQLLPSHFVKSWTITQLKIYGVQA